MHIVRLTPDEGPRLRTLRLRALREAPDAFASTFDETAARPPASWQAQLEALATFVAVHDGADVGMVRGGPDDADLGAAWLLSLWVAPEARGLGVGSALCEALAAWATEAGFDRLQLDVADANVHAVALYARLGFAPTGETSHLPPPRQHVREHRRVRGLQPSVG